MSTTPGSSNEAIEWKFQQVFGDKGATDDSIEGETADIISAVEFDETGDYLAIGDRGGRVVILERNHKTPKKGDVDYKVLTEFQSHEPEFDYLKSLEIEEKINQIRWCKRTNQTHLLLTTNDKTIKLWKVFEKKVKSITGSNFNGEPPAPSTSFSRNSIKIPKVNTSEVTIAHVPRRIYANAHAYHINSISLNSDGETYISADDLRINLWNLSINNQSFNIVDIKPENMEDLTEVITSACFHPSHCNLFMYSSSKGTLKLGDMRDSALCRKYSKIFETEEDPANRNFFSEIISSVSDAKFSRDGRYILSRDYMTLKLWDMTMENRPVKVFNVHEALRSRLCDLYENDCIFDKFECGFSGDGNYVITGSYKNYFHVFDKQGRTHTAVEATRTPSGNGNKQKQKTSTKSKLLRKASTTKKKEDETFENSDFSKKVLHLTWHPSENVIAVAAVNNLYIYTGSLGGPSSPTGSNGGGSPI